MKSQDTYGREITIGPACRLCTTATKGWCEEVRSVRSTAARSVDACRMGGWAKAWVQECCT